MSFLPRYSNSVPFAALNLTPFCLGSIGMSFINSFGQQLAPAPESKVIWHMFGSEGTSLRYDALATR